MSDDVGPDQIEGRPHPRETSSFIGRPAAEREFLDAYRLGRLHHAWILGGPEGVGKATLAYRIARFLLAHPKPRNASVQMARDLFVDPSHPAAVAVAKQKHQDLRVLRRGLNEKTGKPQTEIPVADVRDAIAMFHETALNESWRICIVDAAEDLNRSSANALLKTLEEPPEQSILLLVSHAPDRLLPTIRSRCRRLDLGPLSPDDLRQILADLGEDDVDAVTAAVAEARGSVRRALALLDPELASMGERTRAMLDKLPDLAPDALMDLASRSTGRDGEVFFGEVLDAVRGWLSGIVAEEAGGAAARVEPFAEIWEKLHEGARMIEAYNVDRRPFIVGLFSDMADAFARLRAS